MQIVNLYKPSKTQELEKVQESDWTKWHEMDSLKFSLSREHAASIAKSWKQEPTYVARITVKQAVIDRYLENTREVKVPLEDLDWFNDQIVGSIQIVHKY